MFRVKPLSNIDDSTITNDNDNNNKNGNNYVKKGITSENVKKKKYQSLRQNVERYGGKDGER